MLTPTGKINIVHMLPGEQVTIGGYAVGEDIRFEVNRTDSKYTVKVFDRLVLLDTESFPTSHEVIEYIERF
ncbi:hypothetical protein [Paenibacillus gallinarum]|uniref:Uncharacterized protein n=1 Tax=Paenibacillus gallinarum TaxID=2762232 RepID=A0ABR8T383_9BACL|nr:hypothetical protein [Paenibacillus gallinarum]MBD7970235.1 hypothetical protein [Paenibacillus gallinarum]